MSSSVNNKEIVISLDNLLTIDHADPIQMGYWVHCRVWATEQYLIPLRNLIRRKRKAGTLKQLLPEVQVFKSWVTAHSVYRMLVMSMIQEANRFIEKDMEIIEKDIKMMGKKDMIWVESYDSLFEIMNEIITTSPSLSTMTMVGTPLNGLLAVAQATKSGYALFQDATFNQQFKNVLNAFNAFLKSYASLEYLDINNPEKPGSWISKGAWEAGVWDDMQYNKNEPGYGYTSWNSFFIRNFLPGARPFKGNPQFDICIGCDTSPWTFTKNIALETDFWIKDVNYSLLDIFGGRRILAEKFEGGEIYQGFLSALHSHRWKSPLTGTIERSWVIPGTYFAQRPGEGEGYGEKHWPLHESMPYLAHVAARAVFIFKHELVGYVAAVFIGMVEVSTCVIESKFMVDEVSSPVPVVRGTDIGHFELGGSTNVMIFQKNKVTFKTWVTQASRESKNPPYIHMGTIMATFADSTSTLQCDYETRAVQWIARCNLLTKKIANGTGHNLTATTNTYNSYAKGIQREILDEKRELEELFADIQAQLKVNGTSVYKPDTSPKMLEEAYIELIKEQSRSNIHHLEIKNCEF